MTQKLVLPSENKLDLLELDLVELQDTLVACGLTDVAKSLEISEDLELVKERLNNARSLIPRLPTNEGIFRFIDFLISFYIDNKPDEQFEWSKK